MAFPPSAVAADKADATVIATDHPAHHNALANAINDTVTELVAHEADSTGVHGITDTSVLETTSGAQSKADAKVAQTITNGVTTSAPSQDAVFDALALKATLVGNVITRLADKIWAAGNITLTFSGSAAWVEVANAGGNAGFFDFTFSGVSAGQVVETNIDCLWLSTGAGNGFLDFATVVSGTPTNYFSSTTSTPDAFGLQGLFGAASATGPRHGTYRYVIQSGDISGGAVTVRLMGEAATVTKVLAGLGATGGRIRVGARLLAV